MTLKAGAELLHVRGVVGGGDLHGGRLTAGGCAATLGQCIAQAGLTEAGGIDDLILLHAGCGVAVGAIRLQYVAHLEAVVEESIASAEDGLGLVVLVTIECVSQSNTRGPVAVICDLVLSFPTQAAGEGQEFVDFPVVLEKDGSIKNIGVEGGGAL